MHKDRKKNKLVLERGGEKAQSCNMWDSAGQFGEMAALCHRSEGCPGAPPSSGVLRLCPQMWAEFKDWLVVLLTSEEGKRSFDQPESFSDLMFLKHCFCSLPSQDMREGIQLCSVQFGVRFCVCSAAHLSHTVVSVRLSDQAEFRSNVCRYMARHFWFSFHVFHLWMTMIKISSLLPHDIKI